MRLACLLLASAGSVAPALAGPAELHVYNRTGYIAPDTIATFESKTS